MRTAKDYHLLWLAGMAAPRLTRKAVNREIKRLQENEKKQNDEKSKQTKES